MILKCPACSTRFLVPDSAFGTKPRRVRCGKCKHEWLADGPPPPPDPYLVLQNEPQPEPELTPPPAEPAPIPEGSNLPAKVSDRKLLLRGLMALGALLLIALIGSGILYMTTTGASLFDSAPAAPQLAIEDVKTRYIEVLPAGAETMPSDQAASLPKSWALVVEGTIRNLSAGEVALPQLILATKDSHGALINLYRPDVKMQSLPKDGVTTFTYTLNDISDRVAEVTVQFGSGSETDLIEGSSAARPDNAPAATPSEGVPEKPADEPPHDGGH